MRAAMTLLALAALAACGGKEDTKQQAPAFEKVLPGSASDAMLPYDTARSTAPVAPETYESQEEDGEERTPRARRARPAAGDDDATPKAEPS